MTRDEPERAHGGIVHIDGPLATLGDGARWWLINEEWAVEEARAQMMRNPNRYERRADGRESAR